MISLHSNNYPSSDRVSMGVCHGEGGGQRTDVKRQFSSTIWLLGTRHRCPAFQQGPLPLESSHWPWLFLLRQGHLPNWYSGLSTRLSKPQQPLALSYLDLELGAFVEFLACHMCSGIPNSSPNIWSAILIPEPCLQAQEKYLNKIKVHPSSCVC